MISQPNQQTGFTIIEFVIAGAITLLVLNGLMAIFAGTIRTNADSIRITRMTQELRTVLDVMTREIRRAGYYTTAGPDTSNPHGINQINDAGSISGNGDCILYSYDAINGQNNRGFRLRNGAIEWSQDDTSCTGGNNWQALTEPSVVTVTSLVFSDNSTCTNLTANNDCNPCNVPPKPNTFQLWATGDQILHVRQIDIVMVGQLTNDANFNLNLQDSIRVRNNDLGVATDTTPAQCGQRLPL
ncbi:MAG: hypothetical protein OEY38_18500 [Gammaproteobacteria bacterium]|nr:hypothetical protein [Gammaproteobacteria bacterium]